MAQNFLPCDREQVREGLAEDHLAWFELDAVAELDLAAFYAGYRRDGWGAEAAWRAGPHARRPSS